MRYNERDPEHYLSDERLGNDPFGIGMLVTFTLFFVCSGIVGLAGRCPEWGPRLPQELRAGQLSPPGPRSCRVPLGQRTVLPVV